MPRGNPAVWKQYGSSYAQLSGTSTSIERAHELAPRRLPPVTPALVSELKGTKPAGAPAVVPHRGTGSFVFQSAWSLGVPGTAGAGTPTLPSKTQPQSQSQAHSQAQGQCQSQRRDSGAGTSTGTGAHASAVAAAATAASSSGAGGGNAAAAVSVRPSAATITTTTGIARSGAMTSFSSAGMLPRSYTTESKVNYQPPPADFRRVRSAGPRASQMPIPNDPNDWKTCKQLDFRADRPSETAQPFRLHDAGRLLPSDVPSNSQFATSQRGHFPGRSLRDSQAVATSGCRATQPAGYNIITGAPAYTNNAFEHWDGRDYRRYR